LKNGPVPGAASGLATLDAQSRLTAAQFPQGLIGAIPIAGKYVSGLVRSREAGTNISSGHLSFMPFVSLRGGTALRIGVRISTAAVTNVQLGIYTANATTLAPDSLLLDAGAIDASTTGAKEITISQALNAGQLYYFVALPLTATCAIFTGDLIGKTGDNLSNSTVGRGAFFISGQASLPATASGFENSGTGVVPVVAVRLDP
jgi:hypothetical protein